MINDRFAARFSELQSEWDKMPLEASRYKGSHVEPGIWEKWAILGLALGDASADVATSNGGQRAALAARLAPLLGPGAGP